MSVQGTNQVEYIYMQAQQGVWVKAYAKQKKFWHFHIKTATVLAEFWHKEKAIFMWA